MAFTLTAMSIYGQDTTMLDKLYNIQDAPPITMSSASEDTLPYFKPPSRCLLLALPLELRQQIYMYILPSTYNHKAKGTVWLRGSTGLLSTNSQIHKETSSLMYGMNTFAIEVFYDCAIFDYRWSLSNGLFPNRRLAFPEQLGNRYMALLRNIQISVHVIDQYTGMIKFNYGGSGLMDGLRDQVKFLCQSLSRITEIRCLSVHLKDNTHTAMATHRVLEPILELKNVQQGTVVGNIEPVFKETLCSHLNRTKKAMSLLDLPSEIRLNIYQHLLPNFRDELGRPRYRSRNVTSTIVALSCANRQIYTEFQSFIFSQRKFKLCIYQDLTYSLTPACLQPSRPLQRYSSPISSFYTSMYKQAMSYTRSLSISIAYIPLAVQSPRYRSLEGFLEALLLILQSAPVNDLEVDYVVGLSKSSSGDSHKANVETHNNLTSSTRSLDLDTMGIQRPRRNSGSRRALELSLAESGSRVTTTPIMASPVTTSPKTTHFPSSVLQTPPMLYLITKFNPLMAQVKSRPHGYVRIRRSSKQTSSTEEAEDHILTAAELPSTGSTNQTTFDRSLPSRSHSPAPLQRTDLANSRSSSTKRRSRVSQGLFPNVPV